MSSDIRAGYGQVSLSLENITKLTVMAKKKGLDLDGVIEELLDPKVRKAMLDLKKKQKTPSIWPDVSDFFCWRGQIWTKARRAAAGIGISSSNDHHLVMLSRNLRRLHHRALERVQFSDFKIVTPSDPIFLDADDFRGAMVQILIKRDPDGYTEILDAYDSMVSAVQWTRQSLGIDVFDTYDWDTQQANLKKFLAHPEGIALNRKNPLAYDRPQNEPPASAPAPTEEAP